MPIVRAQSSGSKPVRRVFHGGEAASALEQRVILLGFLALPDAGGAIGMIGIIVVLVHGLDDGGGIHHARAGMSRVPDQPVVPAGTPDHEWRSILIVKSAREYKVINPLRRTLMVCFECLAPDRYFPVRGVKIHGRGDVGIPALPRHQGPPPQSEHALGRSAKIGEKNNVAVDVAEAAMVREVLRAIKNGRKILGAVLIALHIGHVAYLERPGGFGGALFITEQDHFGLAMNALPALDRVAL